MISPLAYVDPGAKLGKNVTVQPFAYIDKNVEIGDDCTIMPYASVLSGTRMGKGNKVFQGAVLGAMPQDFAYKGGDTLLKIGNDNTFRENVVINRATTADGCTSVGNGNFVMEGVHISHDVAIGDNCVFGYGSKIAGGGAIEDNVIFSGVVIMHQYCRVGTWAMVQGGCRFYKDIPPYIIAAHEPIEYYGVNTVVLSQHGFQEKVLKHIANAYRLIYQGNTSVFDALQKIEDQVPMSDEIRNIIRFVSESKRGIIK